tara:strand:+ start:2195 stop:2356 length:162 start_codon:yes stop_codon:yes gene_type:complete
VFFNLKPFSDNFFINLAASSNLDAIASRLEQSLVNPLSFHVKKLILNSLEIDF